MHIICYLHTYLLTPYSRVLLEKLTSLQLVKKFPAFYGTWRFITTFASACCLALSWASSIQSIPPHPTSWRSILILSYHLCLGLLSGLFPSGFPTNTMYMPLPSPILHWHLFVVWGKMLSKRTWRAESEGLISPPRCCTCRLCFYVCEKKVNTLPTSNI